MGDYKSEMERMRAEDAKLMASLPEEERVRRLEGSVTVWKTGCHELQRQRDELAGQLDAETARLDYLLQFLSIDDVGDENVFPGIVVAHERLEEEVGLGAFEDGRAPNLCHFGDNLRDVIDRAVVAHKTPPAAEVCECPEETCYFDVPHVSSPGGICQRCGRRVDGGEAR